MNKKITVFAIAGLIIWNLVLSYFLYTVSSRENSVVTNPGQGSQIVQNLTTFETDFTKVIENNASKAVGIVTYTNGIQYATGSGVIYQSTDDGVIIVTNQHIIQNATTVDVSFANGEVLRADIMGYDELSDIAVLRVRPEFDVQPFTLGDSSLTKVGEWVVAIGSSTSIDFSGSVTAGIISGKNHLIEVDSDNDGVTDWDLLMLQTSTIINSGNSGGALLNLAGELIGINTTKYNDYNGEGMSYVIPINEVVIIVEQLLEESSVNRIQLGISGISVTDIPSYSRTYYGIGVDLDYGLLITNITDGGLAREIGLREKDVLLTINGEEVKSANEFRKLLYDLQAGETIVIQYQRNGQTSEIEVVLQ